MKLHEALSRCTKITPKSHKMEILNNVLIEPSEKGICISATDLEMSYQVEVEGVTTNDTFTAPLRQLRDIVGKKDIKEITWNPENKMITVGATKFFGLPKEEFPHFPYSEGIDLNDFAEVKLNKLKWIMKAMSTDQVRYTMNGVYVDTKEGKLVATDGHRLHMINTEKVAAKSVIVPLRTIKFLDSIKAESVYLPVCHVCNGTGHKLYKNLTEEEKTTIENIRTGGGPNIYLSGQLEVFYKEKMANIIVIRDKNLYPLSWEEISGTDNENVVRQAFFNSLGDEGYYNEIATKPDCEACKMIASNILFVSDGEVLVSRVIDGDFPDYTQVIPKEFNFKFRTTKAALLSAITQTDGIRSKALNTIKLSLGNTCRFSAGSPDTGEVDMELVGEFKKIVKPLKDPCEACKNKKITFCSTRIECDKYKDYNSNDGSNVYPCDGCSDKQGECDKMSSGCAAWRFYRLSIQDTFIIGVNASYLEQALVGDDITWSFTDTTGPTVLTFGEDELAVIMPQKV